MPQTNSCVQTNNAQGHNTVPPTIYTTGLDGTTFLIVFPYEKRTTDIVVFTKATENADPVLRGQGNGNNEYTVNNDTSSVVFNSAPGGHSVIIGRRTNICSMLAQFQVGAAIRAGDLNMDNKQLLFLIQELRSTLGFMINGNDSDPIIPGQGMDLNDLDDVNVGDPVNPNPGVLRWNGTAWVSNLALQSGVPWVSNNTTFATTAAGDVRWLNATGGDVIGGDMITATEANNQVTLSVDLAAVSGLESTNPGDNAGELRIDPNLGCEITALGLNSQTTSANIQALNGNNSTPAIRVTETLGSATVSNTDLAITAGAGITVTRNNDNQLTIANSFTNGLTFAGNVDIRSNPTNNTANPPFTAVPVSATVGQAFIVSVQAPADQVSNGADTGWNPVITNYNSTAQGAAAVNVGDIIACTTAGNGNAQLSLNTVRFVLIPVGGGFGTLQQVTDNGNFTTQNVLIGGAQGTPNIQLNSAGTTNFLGSSNAGDNPLAIWRSQAASAGSAAGAIKAKFNHFGTLYIGGNLQANVPQAPNITLGADGDATFSGNITLNEANTNTTITFSNTTNFNAGITWNGDNDTGLTFNDSSDSSNAKMRLNSDELRIGTNASNDATTTIQLNTAGSATFTKHIYVGKANVESSAPIFYNNSATQQALFVRNYGGAPSLQVEHNTANDVIRITDNNSNITGRIRGSGDIYNGSFVPFSGTGAQTGVGIFAAGVINIVRAQGANQRALEVYNPGVANPTVSIETNGTATFANTITSDQTNTSGYFFKGAAAGNTLFEVQSDGQLALRQPDGTANIVLTGANGTGTFNGGVTSKTQFFANISNASAPNPSNYRWLIQELQSVEKIAFMADGSARFAGNISFSNGKGIDFSAKSPSAGGSTSALLNDYEEGTWTPTIAGGWDNVTYDAPNTGGWYTKIGRVVTAGCKCVISTANSLADAWTLNGLPFAAAATSAGTWSYLGTDSAPLNEPFTIPGAGQFLSAYVSASGTQIVPYITPNTTGPVNNGNRSVSNANIAAACYFYMTITYITA